MRAERFDVMAREGVVGEGEGEGFDGAVETQEEGGQGGFSRAGGADDGGAGVRGYG